MDRMAPLIPSFIALQLLRPRAEEKLWAKVKRRLLPVRRLDA